MRCGHKTRLTQQVGEQVVGEVLHVVQLRMRVDFVAGMQQRICLTVYLCAYAPLDCLDLAVGHSPTVLRLVEGTPTHAQTYAV